MSRDSAFFEGQEAEIREANAAKHASSMQPQLVELPLPIGWLDADAAKVIRRLRHCGFEAYLVGGCVRDLLLGRNPKDFDIATSALPTQVKRAFSNCRLIGRRFRLAHILFQDKTFEVATFRRDPGLSDAEERLDDDDEALSPPLLRSNAPDLSASDMASDPDADLSDAAPSGPMEGNDAPERRAEASTEPEDLLIRSDNVFGTPQEDALRRDFTINGLFYDVSSSNLIDWTGGLHDVEQRTVRTIGVPEIRFREDPVRMLRAIKFAARLRFSIEPATWNALCQVAPDIMRCAPPRILEEVFRMMRGGAAVAGFRLLALSGLLKFVLPELEPLVEAELAAELAGMPLEPYRIRAHEPAATGHGEGGAPQGASRALPEIRVPGILRYLETLDRVDRGEGILPNHLLLAILTMPVVLRISRLEDEASAMEEMFEKAGYIFDEMSTRLRVSRRDRERARLALLGFMKLLWRVSRQAGFTGLVRKSYFEESLLLLMLHIRTGGEDASALLTAVQRLPLSQDTLGFLTVMLEAPAASRVAHPTAPSSVDADRKSESGDPRRRKRRRRRGGRPERLRSEPGGKPGPEGAPAGEDEEATDSDEADDLELE